MLGRRMKVLRQLGTWVLLLVSFGTPVMACMTPGAQMTATERACCRMMHNQCGQMDMPGSNRCCQKVQPSAYESALSERSFSFVIHTVAASVVDLAASQLALQISPTARQVEHLDSSPPESPPSTISILRI